MITDFLDKIRTFMGFSILQPSSLIEISMYQDLITFIYFNFFKSIFNLFFGHQRLRVHTLFEL